MLHFGVTMKPTVDLGYGESMVIFFMLSVMHYI